jgi:diaminopimelate decarboxylase
MMVLMDQVEQLKLVLFAIVQDDQMHLVTNIVLVVQIHKYPKKVDILDQVMNDMLDHCLNMHQYRNQ